MLFNSVVFIFAFLPITLLGYYFLLCKRCTELALAWLVLCSMFFYGWWNPEYVGLIIASMLFNFLMGCWINRASHWRKAILATGIGANLALLGYYKYCDFFISSLNSALNTYFELQYILLPLAISFFTFTQIAFLVDAYRQETREYNFLHYSLFVTFFPHLIAGPIVHHKDLAPQFLQQEQLQFQASNISIGLSIFAMGLFKKMIIADSFAADVSQVYGPLGSAVAATPDFLNAWLGTLSYTLQLYFDFSGYSDMAIGLSLLFGIKLPINFNSPYKATSIIAFWRRWHITLSHFLRNYLYIALGGNRKGRTRRYANLWLTMLLGGLWHGASLNFIIWGALHGFYLMVNHAWQGFCQRLNLVRFPFSQGLTLKIFGCGLTFLAVMIGWVFFRSHDLASARLVLGGMFGTNGWGVSQIQTDFVLGWSQLKSVIYQALFNESHLFSRGLGFIVNFSEIIWGVFGRIVWIALVLALVWLAPNTQQLFSQFSPALGCEPSPAKEWNFSLSWGTGLVISLIMFISLSRLFSAAPSEFMYFTF